MNEFLKPRKVDISREETKFPEVKKSEKKVLESMKGLEKLAGGSGLESSVGGPGPGIGASPKLQHIPVEEIVVNEQVRKVIDPEKLMELAESIRKHGLINPITVRKTPDGKYELVAGHRRFLALRDVLGRKTVECRVLPLPTEAEKLLVQFSENVQREDLHPVELAEVVGNFAFTAALTKFPELSEDHLHPRGCNELNQKNQELTHEIKNRDVEEGELSDEEAFRKYVCVRNYFYDKRRLRDIEKAFVAYVLEQLNISHKMFSVSLFIWSLPPETRKELAELDASIKHYRELMERGVREPEDVLDLIRMVHKKGLSSSELARLIAVRKSSEGRQGRLPGERILNRVNNLCSSLKRSRIIKENPEVRRSVIERLKLLIEELEGES